MPSLSKLDNEFKVKFTSIAKEISIDSLVTVIPRMKSLEISGFFLITRHSLNHSLTKLYFCIIHDFQV